MPTKKELETDLRELKSECKYLRGSKANIIKAANDYNLLRSELISCIANATLFSRLKYLITGNIKHICSSNSKLYTYGGVEL